MITALVLFGLAAVGGIILALQRFTGKPLPSFPLAIVHGLAAAAGLVALIIFVAGGAGGGAQTALIFFLIAALGGFYLFFKHLKQTALPIPVMIVHALVAVTAFLILLVSALK